MQNLDLVRLLPAGWRRGLLRLGGVASDLVGKVFHHLLTVSAASACWSAGGCEMVLAHDTDDHTERAPLAGGALFHTGAGSVVYFSLVVLRRI